MEIGENKLEEYPEILADSMSDHSCKKISIGVRLARAREEAYETDQKPLIILRANSLWRLESFRLISFVNE